MEFKQDEYIILSWDKLCRICLTDTSLSLPIYKLDEIDKQYNMTFLNMLNSCTNLKVSSDDNFPQFICSQCITHMHHALEFKIKCQSSKDTLTQLFYKKNDCNVVIKCEEIQIKAEVDEKVHDDVNDYGNINFVDNVFVTDIDEKKILKDHLTSILPLKNEITESRNVKLVKVHTCPLCQVSCGYRKLVTHKKTHPNTCWKCNINFKSAEEYNEHLKEHEENVCSECGKVFKNKGLCSAHKVLAHLAKSGLPSMRKKYLKKRKVHNCLICHMPYEYRELVAHKKTHTNTCWKCVIDFKSTEEYKNHFKEHEENVCLECGKVFESAERCNAHQVIHHKDKWLCTICGQKLGTQNALKVHYRKHAGEKIYECSYCGEKFLNWNARRYHIRNHHTFEKPFACDVCTRRFSNKSHLVSHMETHTNERRYACTLCDLTFKTKSVLKSHSLKHSGEKRVFCTVCNKGFFKNYSLKVHMVTHTGEKNFVCSLCPKGFSQAHVLRTHMKTHNKGPTSSTEPHVGTQ